VRSTCASASTTLFELEPEVLAAFHELAADVDIVIVEGAEGGCIGRGTGFA
jgi:hypothetical protein